MKKYLFSIVAIVIWCGVAFAQGIEFHQGTFAEALEKAKAENKLVFMDCYTTWCGPCKALAKDVFPLKEVGEYFNQHFVNVSMDMEKGEGIELAKKYEVKAYPTLLFMDADGKVQHTKVGGTDGPGLIEQAKIASDPSLQIGAMHERYKNGERDLKFMGEYVNALYNAYDMDKIKEVGADLIRNTSPETLVDADAFNILMYSGALEFNSPAYKYLIQHKDEVINTEGIGQEAFDNLIGGCYYTYCNKIATEGSLEEVQEALEATKQDYQLAMYSDIETAIYSTFYLQNKEYEKWFEHKLESAKEQMKTDESRGTSIIIQTAYEVAVRPQFEQVHELTAKAIEAVENLMKDNQSEIAGYYCLACLYKKGAQKEKALKNINEYITALKSNGKEADQRVIQLKEQIEAM